jgi:DNA ligase-1
VQRFAQTCAAVAATPGKLEKIGLVAAYLRELDEPDLVAATRFFSGEPLPPGDERALAVGERTLIAAARNVWQFDEAAFRAAYRAHGDLGSALAAVYREPLDLGLFRAPLSPHALSEILREIAAASGRASAKRRQALCERILTRCTTPLEAQYVVKILTGDLRIGLRGGLVVDALARAFARDVEEVRRAVAAAGDIGKVARAARSGDLRPLAVAYGSPIAFMLASPLPFGEYRELGPCAWLVEDKYDGVRVQAHKVGGTVKLFSRTLKDSAAAFPEIVEALALLREDVILDGEVVAELGGRVLPFRYLQTRLQRKAVSPKLLAEVPVTLVAFDVLAHGRESLIDTPLEMRRDILSRIVPGRGRVRITQAERIEPATPAQRIEELFDRSRERGNEGLLFKRLDAGYVPGKRGKWWFKLKRELSTLDVVVVAVEWGHGKRANVLSDYTFAVRGRNGELLTIGKAYSGLTDAEIAEMTRWFLAHRLGDPDHRRIPVEPRIVIEVAFDIVQRSELHESGYALRFPRIVRLRPDKPAGEIDSIETVESIYAAMLEREGVAR